MSPAKKPPSTGSRTPLSKSKSLSLAALVEDEYIEMEPVYQIPPEMETEEEEEGEGEGEGEGGSGEEEEGGKPATAAAGKKCKCIRVHWKPV